MYFQTIQVLGRATSDPELLQSKNGKAYSKVSIAVNTRTGKEKKEEKVSFYDIVLFGKRAETASKLIKKADMVLATGHLEFEPYLSKSKKEAKVSASVIADNWQVVK